MTAKIEAKIICDSMSKDGNRLTTFLLTYPRIVHAEFMTHRVFSRNASSSRAIPVEKMIASVTEEPFEPVYWGKNQRGMQAEAELTEAEKDAARVVWLQARDAAVEHCKKLVEMGVHKQIANRLLEPFGHITVILTATEMANFFNLRSHKMAQPEIQALSDKMLEVYEASVPTVSDNWHLPFVLADEYKAYPISQLIKFSVARCARVSYLNHDGSTPDINKDLKLHDMLLEQGHMSPFEHQAAAGGEASAFYSNFKGWVQYRKSLRGENRDKLLVTAAERRASKTQG